MSHRLRNGKHALPPKQKPVSDSEGECAPEDENVSERVRKQIKHCLDMKPDLNSIESIKTKLNSIKSKKNRKLSQAPLTDNKKIESAVAEFATDMTKMNSNFQTLLGCLCDIMPRLEQIDMLEKRVLELERRLESSEQISKPNYTSATKPKASPFTEENQSDRLARLEYLASEEEREKRLLQVVVTHPELDPNNNDLRKHTCEFLRNKLRMTEREIDPNLSATKNGRENSITVNLSRRLFKKFLYVAKGKLRKTNPELCENLFINDNLTHYNFSLLKLLKRERRLRYESGTTGFVSVFSLDGKVYVKSSPDSVKVHIKNMEAYERFIMTVDTQKEALPKETSQ